MPIASISNVRFNPSGIDRLTWGYGLYSDAPDGVTPYVVIDDGTISAVAHTVSIAADAPVDIDILRNGSPVHTITLGASSTSQLDSGLAIPVTAGDVITIDPTTATPGTPSEYGVVSVNLKSGRAPEIDRLDFGFDTYTDTPDGVMPGAVTADGFIAAAAVSAETAPSVATAFDIVRNATPVHTVTLGAGSNSQLDSGLTIPVTAGDLVTVAPVTATPGTPAAYGVVSVRLDGPDQAVDTVTWGYDTYTQSPAGAMKYVAAESGRVTAVAHVAAGAPDTAEDFEIHINGSPVHTVTLGSSSTSQLDSGLTIPVAAGQTLEAVPVTADPGTPSTFGTITIRIGR